MQQPKSLKIRIVEAIQSRRRIDSLPPLHEGASIESLLQHGLDKRDIDTANARIDHLNKESA